MPCSSSAQFFPASHCPSFWTKQDHTAVVIPLGMSVDALGIAPTAASLDWKRLYQQEKGRTSDLNHRLGHAGSPPVGEGEVSAAPRLGPPCKAPIPRLLKSPQASSLVAAMKSSPRTGGLVKAQAEAMERLHTKTPCTPRCPDVTQGCLGRVA